MKLEGIIRRAVLDEILPREESKTFGAVSTPVQVIDFMLTVLELKLENLKILEPGCGLCDFMTRIYTKHPNNQFTGVEFNPQVYSHIVSLYPYFRLIHEDFLLWEPSEQFDLVIGNPPYGIIGDKTHYPIHTLKDRKTAYKKVCNTWFGKFNIYGAFIEKGLKILKDGGKLNFIVPATFMILDDFKMLRKFLSATGRVKIFYLGSGVFPKKSVSTVILVVEKGKKGIELYEVQQLKNVIKYYEKDDYQGEIIRFETPETTAFEEDSIPLGSIFTLHFAARSPEVRKHPAVSTTPRPGLVPVLTGRNLHRGWIDYENCFSGLWMPLEEAPSLRSFYAIPHLVVGHTKGGKVVAAIDKRCYPWREDIHLIPKCQGVDLDTVEAYLNSEQVEEYMRKLYKDITPHLTITQLKQLPLKIPSLKHLWLPTR